MGVGMSSDEGTGISRRGFLRGGVAMAAGGLAAPALLVTACSRPSESGGRTVSSAPLPVSVPREQVFVLDQIFQYSPVNNFNLYNSAPPNPTRQGLVMDTLWYIDPQSGKWINSLASDKPAYNSDFTQMSVSLRSGVRWSDGTEFTADDLVYTVQMLMANPGFVFSANLRLWVKDIAKTGSHSATFHLQKANPRFHYYFSAGYNAVYMAPKHVWEKAGNVTTFTNFPPVSLGAYKFKQSDPAGYWELYERRDDWQKTTAGILTGNQGAKYVMTIFYGDDSKKVIAASRHGLDVIEDMNPNAFHQLVQTSPSARSWYTGFPWAYPNELNVRYFGPNHTIPPYDNKDVRWALALALDMVGLQTKYEGGIPRVDPLPIPAVPTLEQLFHTPLTPWLKSLSLDLGGGQKFQPWDDQVPINVGAWARKQGHKVGSDPATLRSVFGPGWWKYSQDTAATLLEKNGFKRSGGKWMLPNGQPWSMNIIATPDEEDAFLLATGAQDQWKSFGIDVNVTAMARTDFYTRQYIGDFQVNSSWSSLASNPSPDIWPATFPWTSQFFTPIGKSTASAGSSNFVRFKSSEFDQAVAEMTPLSPTDPKLLSLAQNVVKIWVENMLTISTVSFKKFVTYDTTFWSGMPDSQHTSRDPEYWFMAGRFAVQAVKPTQVKAKS